MPRWTSMAEITCLQDMHDAVMLDVVAQIPGARSVLSTRLQSALEAPPFVVWVPSRDRWTAAQKRPRGGLSSGRSLMTAMAGVDLHCWGSDLTSTWRLVQAIVRASKKLLGPEPFFEFVGGQWLSVEGISAQGELYVLSLAVAIDVPALPDPPTTLRPTGARLDATASVPGDGNLDAGETG